MSDFPIPEAFILNWDSTKGFPNSWQSEQDMLITETVMRIFKNEFLKNCVAFKGGTALYKFHFDSPARFSEDIDLTIIDREASKDAIIDEITKVVEAMGGEMLKIQPLTCSFNSAFVKSGKHEISIKIDIGAVDRFSKANIIPMQLPEMENPRFEENIDVNSYSIEELLGSKMIPLRENMNSRDQRKGKRKGRHLFDVWFALTREKIKIHDLVEKFKEYEAAYKLQPISSDEFEKNINQKLENNEFRSDVDNFICLEFVDQWDVDEAAKLFINEIVSRL